MSQPEGGVRASSRPLHAVARVVVKVVLLAALVGAALVVSVWASVVGLTIVLVLAAIGALMVLNIRQHTRRIYPSYRPRKVMLITGLVVVGFFVALSIVGAVWPR